MKYSKLGVVAAIAATGLLLSACSGGSEQPPAGEEVNKIRVVTSVSNSFPYIVIQAGEQLGTWDGTGIEVEVIEGTTPTIGQILAGNQADIALASGTAIIGNVEQGLEATLVAANQSSWDQMYIASADSDVTRLEDLKGGNFGITGAGSPGHFSVLKLAESFGWGEGDYTVTSLGNIQSLRAALSSGAIDAFAWSSDTAFALEATGDGKILGIASEYVGPTVFHGFAVMDSFMENNPNTVKTFFEAYYAGVKKIQENPELIRDILIDDWNYDPAVVDRLIAESLAGLSDDGVITQAQLDGLGSSVAFNLDIDSVIVKYTFWSDIQ